MTDIKIIVPEFGVEENDFPANHFDEAYHTKMLDYQGLEDHLGKSRALEVIRQIELESPHLRCLAQGQAHYTYNLHLVIATKKELIMMAEDSLVYLSARFIRPLGNPESRANELMIWVAVLLQIRRLDMLQEMWDSILGNIHHPHHSNLDPVYRTLRYWLELFDYDQLKESFFHG